MSKTNITTNVIAVIKFGIFNVAISHIEITSKYKKQSVFGINSPKTP